MPTYEYKCAQCGIQFEKVQRITEQPLTLCPEPGCGGSISRLISKGAAVLFKGSGFYQTDYRSDSYKKAVSAESSSSKESGSTEKKSSEKTESKSSQPVAKTENA